jgi:hypothetical protein
MKKKSIKKQSTSKIKWGHQNPQVVSCQTLNIYKKIIELKGKIEKKNSNSQKNSKHKKKTKEINFQQIQWWCMKFLKIIKNDWSELGLTFKIYDTNHKARSQRKRQTKKNNNVKF